MVVERGPLPEPESVDMADELVRDEVGLAVVGLDFLPFSRAILRLSSMVIFYLRFSSVFLPLLALNCRFLSDYAGGFLVGFLGPVAWVAAATRRFAQAGPGGSARLFRLGFNAWVLALSSHRGLTKLHGNLTLP